MTQIDYMHFERLDTTPKKLDKEFGVRTLEELLKMYGKNGWELVYFRRRITTQVEMILLQR